MKESRSKEARAGRLADALRANLQRRKAQARAVAADQPDESALPDPPTLPDDDAKR